MIKRIIRLPGDLLRRYRTWKNRKILEMSNVQIEGNLFISDKVHLAIDKRSNVKFGKNFICRSETAADRGVTKISVRQGAELIIGDNSGISSTLLYCTKQIHIGNNVKIGFGGGNYGFRFSFIGSKVTNE